jgi:SSS family solute:Na+ symporter
VILFGTIISIAIYGVWSTRNRSDMQSYVRGKGQTPWWAIGLSVMATQASAVTFLSTPGQGYASGLGFIQIYFGVPLAMIIISIFAIPIFHKLNVYTAYEYLERRFDVKTRLLGAGLFLLQRGIGAGLTIYAPAIVLSTVFGWSLETTIISTGLLVIMYTTAGGTDAVLNTQKYQLGIIFLGMVTALVLLLTKLPAGLSFADTMHLAAVSHKLDAINFSFDPHERYTFWSGILGGTFLMLSYFGTDQSQVQRYLSGSSIRESRLGLLFNAVCKIPMQFAILLLGVLMFVFYQFSEAPLFFDSTAAKYMATIDDKAKASTFENSFITAQHRVSSSLHRWIEARKAGDAATEAATLKEALEAQKSSETIRAEAAKEISARRGNFRTNDADYVFITFVLRELPHGVIGLLVVSFMLAALSSKAAELNALGTASTVDLYRVLIKRDISDDKALRMTKWFTVGWGVVAIVIALCARFSENLIQAVNILGSLFYGVMLALFVVAFGIRRVGGSALFWSALVAQAVVIALYFSASIAYLWYPLIGCGICVALSLLLQPYFDKTSKSLIEKSSA